VQQALQLTDMKNEKKTFRIAPEGFLNISKLD